ncbi:PREDICTED: Retrovirus-related Pol poly from transposon [Prunus dulcis]|uniref:PREDICTED: Retrovirus-related Pol poly from transposon n=1 Tax=Prunus dulcis TaxID=3755 RepID=A0A5E4G7P4_PRUDU|nr:PREDICTED: Retrovirus-related Pol poly from transposon [Prunus dulcis]VVA40554.1 PREDICTED: Retrovirus-related Pol poly from transposon [Prunus dulcis]
MSGSGGSEVRTPIFSGENYEFWRIKMMTIFKSHGLWNLVEKGFKTSDSEKKKAEESSEDDVDGKMAAVLMQDAKALGIIQNAVSDQIFPRIANAESSKMAWDLLYGEYHGGDQVRSVKLQNLRREFEYSRMRDDETLSGYLTRLNDLINQMKTFGEILPNARLVQKVLISLSKPYDPICLVIENTKNIETVELQEILAILKSQEQRFDMHTVDAADKAFASFSVSSKGQQNRGNSQSSGQKSQKNWNPKGKPWESKGKPNQNSSASYNSFNSSQPANQEAVKPQCKVCSKYHFGECRYKGKPKCYNCERFGHLARECTAAKTVQKANSASQLEMTGNLFYANSTVTGPRVNGEWYIDSGCSNHMTGNVELLVDVRTNIAGKVQMPTGDLVNVAGMGSLVIDTNKGRKYVREVMYLPGLKENLLSVGQMDEHGYFLVFGGGMCSVYDGPSLESLVMKVKKKVNRCYPLVLLSENQVVLKASVTHSTETWHRRLGHLHFGGLKQLRDKEMVHGLPQLEDYSGVCEGCQFGKQHREEFPRNQAQRATAPLELVHVDLCGPMRNDSIAGNKYFMLLIDDFSRMIWVYFLRYKSDAFNCFRKFKAMTELQSGFKIKCLRSDRGGEFKSSEFDLFCEKEGIQRQFTLAYTPQQNGVVERKNRTVIEMAKSMLHEKKMPYFLWAEAVHTSVYILNRCPTKALNNITPFQAYSGRKPGIAHLKVFGSLCYVHIPVERRHKLEPKSFKGVFVGYATCEKGYRVFDPLSKKLFLSRDIVFDEEAAWNWEENSESISPSAGSFIHGDISTGSSDRMVLSPTSSTLSPPRRVLSIEDSDVQFKSPISGESASMSHLSEGHNQAFDHTPLKWRNLNEVLAQCNLCIMDPEKYEDAKQDKSWLKAMEDELVMIEKKWHMDTC